MLRKIAKVAEELPPVGGGGQRANALCPPPTGNKFLHQIATPPPQTQFDAVSESIPGAPMSSTLVKGKRKRAHGKGHRKNRKGAGAPGPYTSLSGTREARGGRGEAKGGPPP